MATLRSWPILAVAGVLVLLACNGEALAPVATATPTVTPSPSPTPTPSPTPVPTATPTPTPTATPPSAALGAPATEPALAPTGDQAAMEILQKSFEAMAAIESLHLRMDAEIKITAGQTETTFPITLEGDFQAPDRARSKVTVSLGFFTLEMETIAIGETIYVTNPQTGEWEIASESAFLIPSPTEIAGSADVALLDPVLLGQVVLEDGTSTFRVRGAPPPDLFGEVEGEATAEFWVGVDDLLVRKITAQVSLDLANLGPLGGVGVSGPANVAMTIWLSGFDEPVTIEAPPLP